MKKATALFILLVSALCLWASQSADRQAGGNVVVPSCESVCTEVCCAHSNYETYAHEVTLPTAPPSPRLTREVREESSQRANSLRKMFAVAFPPHPLNTRIDLHATTVVSFRSAGLEAGVSQDADFIRFGILIV